MKNKTLLILIYTLKLFGQKENIDNKKFEKYLPNNFEINTITSGKFDDDLLNDYLLILNNKTENVENLITNKDTLSKRKVIILKGLSENNFKKIYDNDNLVPCREYGGKSDNLYDSLSINKSIFSYKTCEAPLEKESYKIKTFKLKYINNEFILIYYKEHYYKSPEDNDGIVVEINEKDINQEVSKKFNFYDWLLDDYVIIRKSNVLKFNNLAFTYYKRKDYYDAEYLLNKIIKFAPTRVVAYLNIADCYWETKDKPKAIENYKKYIQLMTEQKKDLKKIPKYVYERIK